MSKQHQAAFLDGAGKSFRVGPLDSKQPGKGEILIKNKAVAINPVDWKVQDTGMFVESWPIILGEDVAGEVIAVGEDVNNLKVGQRVLAHSPFLFNKVLQTASFQEQVIVPAIQAVPIPDSMKFEDAAVLPLALSTAAAGLYQSRESLALALDLPSENPKKTGKTVLIWGGSSSVGMTCIQLAVASGATVITTCSPRNKELVEKLGAKAFDYNSPSIVGDLIDEVKKGEFVGAYDSIGDRESAMQCGQIIAQLGGGILADVLPPPEELPATVQSKFLFALTIFTEDHAHVGKHLYQDFLPQALASGQIQPLPRAEVVGHGLGAIQEACNIQKKGVSAKKIVVTL